MKAHGALAVVPQPDVRIRRLLAVVPGHFQAAPRRIQPRLGDGDRRQVRMLVRHRRAVLRQNILLNYTLSFLFWFWAPRVSG